MSATIPCYARTRNEDTARQVQELRQELGDALLAQCIGVKRVALDWQRQPVPVQRAVAMLHCLTFRAGQTIRLVDLLTNFRYTGKLPQSAQNAASCVAPGETSRG